MRTLLALLILGATIAVSQEPPPPPPTFSIRHSGPLSFARTANSWHAIYTPGATSHVYFTFTVPEGVELQLFCGAWGPCPVQLSTKRPYLYNGGGRIMLRVKSMRHGRIPIKMDAQSGTQTVQHVLPLFIAASDPAMQAPIEKWERTMIQLGRKWCKPTEVYGFGAESQVWYYDGARVFFQIADYTGDKSFEACALNIAKQYRDYVINNKGKIPLWRIFTAGLRIAYQRTGDESYREAVRALHDAQITGGDIGESMIRETAYFVSCAIDFEKLYGEKSAKLERAVDFLIGHMDRLTSGSYSLHQTFFDGIGLEGLINYYEHSRNPRVVPAIRKMLDWIATAKVGGNGPGDPDALRVWTGAKLMTNPEPVGPKCDWGCRSYSTDLINLTAPAFAWLWQHSREEKYRIIADEMFAHSLDSDISYSGKIYSQNYKWSPDWVKWRLGPHHLSVI